MIKVLGVFVVFVCFLFALYGAYRVAKTLSYTIFYEDMVQDTVIEMVKTEALNN